MQRDDDGAAKPGLAGKKRTRSSSQVKRHEEVVWSQPARAADQVAADRAHALGRAHCDGALTARRLTARRAETFKSWLRRIRGAGAPARRLSPSHGARSFEFQRVGLWALPLRAAVRHSASATESSLVVNGRPSVRLYTEFCSDPVKLMGHLVREHAASVPDFRTAVATSRRLSSLQARPRPRPASRPLNDPTGAQPATGGGYHRYLPAPP